VGPPDSNRRPPAAKPDRALLSPARVGNGAGRGRFGLVRGCPLGTGQDRCEWHASGTASENDVRGNLAEWPSARPQGEARLRRACLVGKGRRPAAGVTWDSNPLRPCSNNRGSGHEGVVTCPFLVLVVTARARRGSPDDQGGTDPKRTRVRRSAPGGRPGHPACLAAVPAVLSGRGCGGPWGRPAGDIPGEHGLEHLHAYHGHVL
jgi:hypothetical protein